VPPHPPSVALAATSVVPPADRPSHRVQQPPPLPVYPDSQELELQYDSEASVEQLRAPRGSAPQQSKSAALLPQATYVDLTLSSQEDDADNGAPCLAPLKPPLHPRSSAHCAETHDAKPALAAAPVGVLAAGERSPTTSRCSVVSDASPASSRFSGASSSSPGRAPAIDRSRFPPAFAISWNTDPITGKPLNYPVVRFASTAPVAAAGAASDASAAASTARPGDSGSLLEHMIEPVGFSMHLPGVGDCVLTQIPLKLAWALRRVRFYTFRVVRLPVEQA
jgi:hypothetical protein